MSTTRTNKEHKENSGFRNISGVNEWAENSLIGGIEQHYPASVGIYT